MARFNFRLQPLLNVKEQIEEQKEIEYALAIKRHEEEKRKLRLLFDFRVAQIEEFRTSLKSEIDPAKTKRYNNVLERLKDRIKEQEVKVEAAAAFREKKRLELIEAMQERKMLDNVKEKRFEDYLEDEKLAEKRQVDELVSYQYSSA